MNKFKRKDRVIIVATDGSDDRKQFIGKSGIITDVCDKERINQIEYKDYIYEISGCEYNKGCTPLWRERDLKIIKPFKEQDEIDGKMFDIINHYGVMHQLKYMQTEMFELIESIVKHEHFKESQSVNDIKDITGELADVKVFVEQIRIKYGITQEEILEVMKFKVDRQLKRIEEE